MQAKLASNAVDRALRLKSSPSLLAGFVYDDRGNKMSPSHTNKRGIRYRYYVSKALLQRVAGVGSISRVSAPDIEGVVLGALRAHLGPDREDGDRALIEQHLEKAVVKLGAVEMHLRPQGSGGDETIGEGLILAPWISPSLGAEKGVTTQSGIQSPVDAETQEVLLSAIAKARTWVDEIVQGRIKAIAEFAERENKSERYIRMLMSLAFVSPQQLEALINGHAQLPTMTTIAQALPISWSEQKTALMI